MTEATRPEKWDVHHHFPSQSPDTRQHFAHVIDDLISASDLSKSSERCCLVYDPAMAAHRDDTTPDHPECPSRTSRIQSRLGELGLVSRCLRVESRLARREELLLIHNEAHVEAMVESQRLKQVEYLRLPDETHHTYLQAETLRCALLSCGSLLTVVEAVCGGGSCAQTGMAVIRPPGHHAEVDSPVGFCVFNNVAIAAAFAQKQLGLQRVLILDWDIHHGNGSQHQFYEDPSVLYVSLHRYEGGEYFPGSTDADVCCVGRGRGEGYNVNIPWGGGEMGDAEYLAAFTQIIMPIAYQFDPDLVLVSAGFDAADGDPLGGCRVSPPAYGHMTHMLSALANGRLVLALEGGYNLAAMSESASACVSVLLGDPCPALPQPAGLPCHSARQTINAVLNTHKTYWSALRFATGVPSTDSGKTQERIIPESSGASPFQQQVPSPRSLAGVEDKTIFRSRIYADIPDPCPLLDSQ